MRPRRIVKTVLKIAAISIALYVVLVLVVYFAQRSIIFLPSHGEPSTALVPWVDGNRVIGYCHEVPNPRAVWLMLHGNAGQAAHRDYVLNRMSEQDCLYVLEYPGYGHRKGKPSRDSINSAAAEAYGILRTRYPETPVCILAESVGGGPACALAEASPPPDKIVLIVPFDSMANVASRHYWFLPVGLMLLDKWDNVETLKRYSGPVDIFAATEDMIIPFSHAKRLAQEIPGARLVEISGGHNDWADNPQVLIEPPIKP